MTATREAPARSKTLRVSSNNPCPNVGISKPQLAKYSRQMVTFATNRHPERTSHQSQRRIERTPSWLGKPGMYNSDDTSTPVVRGATLKCTASASPLSGEATTQRNAGVVDISTAHEPTPIRAKPRLTAASERNDQAKHQIWTMADYDPYVNLGGTRRAAVTPCLIFGYARPFVR